ncbi:MAG: hypothetical protein H6907_16355 [Hyphomicrobiales bacterium]|nr:hypothetical protein [Hyphomicrobiales bacterium]MCP5373299.1 hypothetical protein [Hyphomicrobiales bacterium]
MRWVHYKLPAREAAAGPAWVHYGIPRTGSSSVRFLLRRAWNAAHLPWQHLETVLAEGARGADRVIMEAPDRRVLDFAGDGARFFTTLRDPLRACRSLYYWARGAEGLDTTLAEFAAALPRSYNPFARYLAALAGGGAPSAPDNPMFWRDGDGFFADLPDDELLAMAEQVLAARFPLVGLLERFDETAFLLARSLGWRTLPLHQRINFSVKDRQALDGPDPAAQARMEEATAVDRVLYDRVAARFEDRAAALAGDRAAVDEYAAACARIAGQVLQQKNLLMVGGDVFPGAAGGQAGGLDMAVVAPLARAGRLLEVEDYLPVT